MNEFYWLLHERTGILNLHELQKYSIQSLQTFLNKCQRLLSLFANVCVIFILNTFIIILWTRNTSVLQRSVTLLGGLCLLLLRETEVLSAARSVLRWESTQGRYTLVADDQTTFSLAWRLSAAHNCLLLVCLELLPVVRWTVYLIDHCKQEVSKNDYSVQSN